MTMSQTRPPAVAREIDGEHRVAVPCEPARLQRPDRVIHAGAVDEHHRGQFGIERLSARGGKDRPAVDAEVHQPFPLGAVARAAARRA